MSTTRLLIQPGAGIGPIIEAIENATRTVHIVIFRFDRADVEAALKRAVRRGLFVHALVAHTSAGEDGEKSLRQLELRLLANGITVARTATDLARYHYKMMIVDSSLLFVLGFNFTHLDVERTRGFGIVTDDAAWVAEAERLFHADTTRQPYVPGCDTLIVSPHNARSELMEMLRSARHELLIYDNKLWDSEAMKILAEKVRAGVDVQVIGTVGKRAVGVRAEPLHMRLHAQAIVRDGEEMFLGSQSLRALELDARREVGMIVREPDVVRRLAETFEEDCRRIRDRAAARVSVEQLLNAAEDPRNALESEEPAALVVKAAVKDAIKEAILDSVPDVGVVAPLKQAVKLAAKEALRELAPESV